MTRIMSLSAVLVGLATPAIVLAHSGGTDSNGCHAGSQPYHCHSNNTATSDVSDSSSGIDGVDAWDLNLGYRYSFDGASPVPYFGLSIGQRADEEDVLVGVDLGFQFARGMYIGYVSTSNSIQFGYRALHFSANRDSIGIGIRFPARANSFLESTVYVSGSGLFGADAN